METTFNEKAQRYQDEKTGKFVAASKAVDLVKLDRLLNSVNINIIKQSAFINTIKSDIIQSTEAENKQTSLLEKLVNLQSDNNRFTEEESERSDTKEKLSDKPRQEPIPTQEDYSDDRRSLIPSIGVGGIGSLIGSALKFSAIAAVVPIVYKFLQGFIDQKTGGMFTEYQNKLVEFVRDIPWRKIADNLTNLVTTLSAVPWDFLIDNIGKMAIAFGVFNVGLTGLIAYLKGKAFAAAIRGSLDIPGGGSKIKGKGIGGALMSALTLVRIAAAPVAGATVALTPTMAGENSSLSEIAAANLRKQGISEDDPNYTSLIQAESNAVAKQMDLSAKDTTPTNIDNQDAGVIGASANFIGLTSKAPSSENRVEKMYPSTHGKDSLIEDLTEEIKLLMMRRAEALAGGIDSKEISDRIELLKTTRETVINSDKSSQRKAIPLLKVTSDIPEVVGSPKLEDKTRAIASQQAISATASTVIVRQGDTVNGGNTNNGGDTIITNVTNVSEPTRSLNGRAN